MFITVEASEIAPGLWQGSKPPLGPIVGQNGFDLLVLCAREIQPASVYFPGVKVVHAPNDDAPNLYPFTKQNLLTAVQASQQVVAARCEGKNVLITCAAGLNRSGLVMALALHQLYGWSGDACIHRIRRKRNQNKYSTLPLSNRDFVRVLSRLPRRNAIELPGLGSVSPATPSGL